MKSTIIALAAAGSMAALIGTAAPALAQSKGGDLVIVYSDLDLDTAKGQKTLEQRIDRAAREFCSMDRKATGSRVRSNQASECYKQARTMAKQQMAKLLDDKRLGG